MRALRYSRYGPPDVLAVEDVPEPTPTAGRAKVRVRAAGLNPIDWKIRAGQVRLVPLFPSPPRGLGFDFAGEIVAVGGGATDRHIGERVFGSLGPFARDGACAEFVEVPYARMLPIPAEVGDIEAAALPMAGGTALQALTDEARLAPGQRILITGAAGGVGHFAVQIARHLGAHVVGVCSGANAELVRNLGGDEAVDYAKVDFTQRDDRFEVVFDAAGASTFPEARRVLTESGCYINTLGNMAGTISTIANAIYARFASKQRAIPFVFKNGAAVWQRVLDLLRQGALRAHVERTIAMEETPEALRSMETGHGRGKIVVRLG